MLIQASRFGTLNRERGDVLVLIHTESLLAYIMFSETGVQAYLPWPQFTLGERAPHHQILRI
jgi:hypothetical protein